MTRLVLIGNITDEVHRPLMMSPSLYIRWPSASSLIGAAVSRREESLSRLCSSTTIQSAVRRQQRVSRQR